MCLNRPRGEIIARDSHWRCSNEGKGEKGLKEEEKKGEERKMRKGKKNTIRESKSG